MRKIDAKEHKRMERRIKKRLQKWRNRYKEIRNKRVSTASFTDKVMEFEKNG